MLASVQWRETRVLEIDYVGVAGELKTTELPKVAPTVDKVPMGLKQHQKAAPEQSLENATRVP